MDSYQIGDRRPLALRGWKISEQIARWLARRGITPNAISIAGMLCGIAAGIMFFETSRISHPWIFWLSGAVLVQLRLLANLYDGMVAVLRQIASPVGELFNEVPDRVSDAATLIGFGYAAGSDPLLGFIATVFAIFLAYLRAEGKVAGAHQEFCGPMAKQQRMATITLVAIACAIVPGATDWQVPMFALWLIIAGCIITAIRRLQRISATLRHRWRKSCGAHSLEDLRERLLKGSSVYILFPEGTRTRTGAMATFKPGLGRLLAGTSVPIVPCYLNGTFAALPASATVPCWKRICVTIGKPLSFSATTNDRTGWELIAAASEDAVRNLAY